jgi:hypothetical protein
LESLLQLFPLEKKRRRRRERTFEVPLDATKQVNAKSRNDWKAKRPTSGL